MGEHLKEIMDEVQKEKEIYGEVSDQTTLWAFKELLEHGFNYVSALKIVNNL